MNCHAYQQDLVALLDGELDPPRASAVGAHLEACSVCQSEQQALDQVWSALDVLPELDPRPEWLEEVEAMALELASSSSMLSRARPQTWGRSLRVWAAAAALLLVAGGVWKLAGTEPTGGREGSEIARTVPAPPSSQGPDDALFEGMTPEQVAAIRHMELIENIEEIENYDLVEHLEAMESLEDDEVLEETGAG